MEHFAAGIIPYTITENGIYFLLGLEKRGWSGFVGSSESGEHPIDTALREFNEESAMIFNNYQLYDKLLTILPIVEKTPTGKTAYLWFIDFPKEIIGIESQFEINKSKLNKKEYHEKSKLKWFNFYEIKNNKNIFKKLKNVIISNFLF
jgi:predicted NUDIX family NTP pyrophosphohydrolase